MWLEIDRITQQQIGDARADEPATSDGSYGVRVPPGAFAWAPDLRAFAKVFSLSESKDERWREVKARRDKAEWGGCATPLGFVDTDPDSQRKVGGAVQLAMIAMSAGQPFALDWTMKDNSTVAHDGPAMIAMGVAVGQHVAACHEAALAKRAAIEAAADQAAVDAVAIEGGWPS